MTALLVHQSARAWKCNIVREHPCELLRMHCRSLAISNTTNINLAASAERAVYEKYNTVAILHRFQSQCPDFLA